MIVHLYLLRSGLIANTRWSVLLFLLPFLGILHILTNHVYTVLYFYHSLNVVISSLPPSCALVALIIYMSVSSSISLVLYWFNIVFLLPQSSVLDLLSMKPWAAVKQNSMAVPPAPVRVPSQRPLAPRVPSVTSVANNKGDEKLSWGLCTDLLAFVLQLRKTPENLS